MKQQPDHLADMVRAFMAEHGLKRQEMARLLGYSEGRAGYNTVTYWLTGKGLPPPMLPLALKALRQELEDRPREGPQR
jgi:hypothetical protein